jgi:hypothetical protein
MISNPRCACVSPEFCFENVAMPSAVFLKTRDIVVSLDPFLVL